MFALNPRLAKDTIDIGALELSRLLLMNDATYPWVILVPQRDGIREICELTGPDRHLLMDEIAQVSEALVHVFRPDKVNVAALGNVVPQLHVHIVARFAADASWPDPIWGKHPAKAYAPRDAQHLIELMVEHLGLD